MTSRANSRRLFAPPDRPPGSLPPLPHRGRSAKADALLAVAALGVVLCGAAIVKYHGQSTHVVTIESTTEETTGSASTFPPVELTSTSATAVLAGTATPGAVVRVLDRQAVADNRGGWRITVDLVPGTNHVQAVATELSGLSRATDFMVVYNPPAATADTTAATPTDTSAPPAVAHATTAADVPVTILSPLDGAVVTTRRITMSGTAAPDARVNAVGTVVTATKKGVWSAVVTLKPGAHRVTVTATTPAGFTSASITVSYNPPPTTTAPPETTAPTQTTTAATTPVDTAP